jgi:phenylalanyl-tRNA synthetase beta chain
VDPHLAPVAAARAAELLREIGAGTPEATASEAAARRFEPLLLSLAPRRARDLLGAEIATEEMRASLRAFGFDVRGEEPLAVTVPTRRRDITEEVDLIEEVGRAHGLENLPDVPAGAAAIGSVVDEEFLFEQRVRDALVGFGFSEALTPTLADPRRLALTWPLAHDRDRGEPRFVGLQNPPSPEASVLRSDLAAGLLGVVAHHLRHGAEGTRVFEVGRVFEAVDGGAPRENRQVAFAIAGIAAPDSWEGERDADFFDAKGVAEALLERLGVDTVETRSYSASAWKPGEAAVLHAQARLGWIGRVEPRVARAWKIEWPVFVFLASLETMRAAVRRGAPFTPFGRHPAVKRDLAFFVPERVAHADVEERMREAAGTLLASVRLFDVYRGPNAPAGTKSLAYSLLFAHPERTLQESEVEAAQESVVRALTEGVGAVLRERTVGRNA